MNTEYDCKFEEMKKYIPFLENMITRLESTSALPSNPRQAQLDKIRSLRDLLSNKNKRMKMENLLKCEQVLVNLYAKVERRDTLSGVARTDSGFSIDTPTHKEKSDLEAVRNKLKTVVKRQENVQDTLPEILPRSEVNDVHTSGTKEPALFQRRPNQQSNSTAQDNKESRTSPRGSTPKRNYTRVLVSPESGRWSSVPSSTEKPLFSRRSPRKSPRRYSPSYHKKERKKTKDSQKRRDLNITLNVPEESLNSLNTKDILSRIINCSDGDVDIDTLRELRKQILGELQKTGAKDDISDLILKSYNKNTKKIKHKLKEEVEEGELSDSESEAIESIYGSLVFKEPGQTKMSTEKDTQPRKIQICLVINSDDKPKDLPKQDLTAEFAELEMYEKENTKQDKTTVKEHKEENSKAQVENADAENNVSNIDSQVLTKDNNTTNPKENVTIATKENVTSPMKEGVIASTKEDVITSPNKNENIIMEAKESIQFKANFYKPLTEQSSGDTMDSKNKEISAQSGIKNAETVAKPLSEIESTLEEIAKSPEIPLLHDRTIEKKPPDSRLSEIDILQALKNEILCDISMPGTETTTPPLHQPKVIKVASAQEILPKKRISIEKYKEKSVSSSKLNPDQISFKDDQTKKPSLKLTDKECERFFNTPKISFDDEDESLDDDGDILASDVYGDLAPKSPDHEDCSSLESVPPVIIPVDPVKLIPVNQKTDVDMRTLPLLSPSSTKTPLVYSCVGMSSKNDLPVDQMKSENRIDQINTQNRPTLIDPRVRRDTNISNHSPNPHAGSSERNPRNNNFPSNSTSSTPNPVMTPNARTYEMTPTHQSFEIDQASRKHVYVPTMNSLDYREREKSVTKEARSWDNIDSPVERRSRVDPRDNLAQNSRYNDSSNTDKYNNIHKNDRYHSDNRDDVYHRSETTVLSTQSFGRVELTTHQSFSRSDCSTTLSHSFGRIDCPPAPSHQFGRVECPSTPSHPFGRLECPPTPSHPFGRIDCPPTPSHPFGRTDCPSTPSHPFGRMDCPPTPSHPFGTIDCSPTPSHPFGRLDCPPTPNHPFGRSDCPPTPSHPFGRSDCPPTPSHPFGRTEVPLQLMYNMAECPPTPSNLFSGGDCPSTPTPLFGRNDCPPNLSHTFAQSECAPTQTFGFLDSPQASGHSFNRSDPTKNTYGRSDFNTQKFTKDPRLNRKPESDSKSQYDERGRGYYRDRDRYRRSPSSHKPYSGSDNHRNYDIEQSTGRNSKYKYYAPELSGRSYKDQEKYDGSFDRSVSKDRDRRYNRDPKNREVSSRNDQSEKSYARSMRLEHSRSFSRGPSGIENISGEPKENKQLIKSNAGRSFTINTSINSTFQKKYNSAKKIQEPSGNFDARRQRAASVGRTLSREPSVGRTLAQVSKPKPNFTENKRDAFRRASSVGRDVFGSLDVDKRSFQEIKADFKSCKLPTNEFSSKKSEHNIYKSINFSENSGRSRKDIYEREKIEKRSQESSKSYSPRMNYRDPRMRKLLKNKNDKYGQDARKSGIVYSNDNIVTGTILASGYGVKNYKIPKIKRAIEEKEENIAENIDNNRKKEEKDKQKIEVKKKDLEKQKVNSEVNKESKDENTTEETLTEHGETALEQNEPGDGLDKLEENLDRRQTRFGRKNMIESKAENDIVAKPKNIKKVIYESDSDNELNGQDKDTKGKSITKDNKADSITKATASPVKNNKSFKKLDPADLDSRFEIDELEMFSDNIVSDPVIDNINALIAGLDNDLSTSKSDSSHHFTKEISLENMMQNISSPEKDENITQIDEESAKIIEAIDKIANNQTEVCLVDKAIDKTQGKVPSNISSVSESNDTRVCESPKDRKLDGSTNDLDKICLMDPIGHTPTQSDATHNRTEEISDDFSLPFVAKTNSEAIDSTTLDENNIDSCSTPDSTIITEAPLLQSVNEESLPGSTNEVTSTELIESKPSASVKEIAPALDSIGSLLSILQDKSKIKELLSMLGDQSSENNKIKKKLEKLSEIVSDDEESCDVSTEKVDQSEANKVEIVKITTNDQMSKIVDKKVTNSLEDDKDINENDPKFEDDVTKSDIEAGMQETDTETQNDVIKPKKKRVKKTKCIKKSKGKLKKVTSIAQKRVTRATAAVTKPKVQKLPRELMQLHEDIREMFIRDDVLSATGIRMCRLAKLVDEKIPTAKGESVLAEGPVVVLEKYKNTTEKQLKKKKIGSKTKVKSLDDDMSEIIKGEKTPVLKHKPGPKSKIKSKKDADPYAFESDSVGDNNTVKANEEAFSSASDSENDSLASSQSFGSTELLADIKKKTKRKRRGWQAGVIKTKAKKKKVEPKPIEPTPSSFENVLPEQALIPDPNCFTDQSYCFRKDQLTYSCHLCAYTGADIVLHYRNQHPHVEIPLSRMSPEVAKEAIEQCEEINFKAISKIPSDKYVCTFCFKEFANNKTVLETFFWHIVSMHTGEYKQNCSQCTNVNNCPFNLDIPPPPKDIKGQLIGFMCEKCNFTQISLENLKTHVIIRHNDEQTAVYTINLSIMTKKAMNNLLRRSEGELINSRVSRDSTDKDSESEGVKTRTSTRKGISRASSPIQSKITFDADDTSEISDLVSETSESGEIHIKVEKIDSENTDVITNNDSGSLIGVSEVNQPTNVDDKGDDLPNEPQECLEPQPSNDIVDYPHFKINLNEAGGKEYFCCINGNYHFKTTLLISMKKHVQFKHSENWDGYCYVCKVIVTPQGVHNFRDCLQHYLEKHMDSFPIFEKEEEPVSSSVSKVDSQLSITTPSASKTCSNVRPLSNLVTKVEEAVPQEGVTLPVIQSVMSLGASTKEPPKPVYPAAVEQKQPQEKTIKYEEHQAEVESKKYFLVIETMKTPENMIKIFKCSGRYCSYATDSPEDALAHATTHQRIGGVDALNCCYCDFDSMGNAVDLVMHVFKIHGSCLYCCQKCFYRAASSQAVGVHISRVHGVAPIPGSVLRAQTVSSIPLNKHNMLTREQAVSYYVCSHTDRDGPCKFRTYTPDKFGEHLLQRHATTSTHPCHLCSIEPQNATDLVQHMKSHGLGLYQCTWCVHGADNEGELLTHVSCVHPDKQPQAYIRIITNKDGSSGLRVLPLAFLNRHKVPSKDVTSSATKEHPVREAERSIEMEALIRPFMTEPTSVKPTETPIQMDETPIQMVETPVQLDKTPVQLDKTPVQLDETPVQLGETPVQLDETPVQLDETPVQLDETPVQLDEMPIQTAETPIQTAETPIQTDETPIQTAKMPEQIIKAEVPTHDLPVTEPTIPTPEVVSPSNLTPIVTAVIDETIEAVAIKTEPGNQGLYDIVVIDSDDDVSAEPLHVVDLSVDEPSSSSIKETQEISISNQPPKIIAESNLYTCPKCKQVCKNMGGLKRHVYSCLIDNKAKVQCPHCMITADNLENLVWHYVADHSEKNTFECSVCSALLVTENLARKHYKKVHKESNVVITRNEKDGTARFTVSAKKKLLIETPKEKFAPKRKLSGPKVDTGAIKRRFGPQEIDQLPLNPILEYNLHCSLCEFSTKVRLNMVRHLQFHADQQPVPQTAPVNPVPHLESNEKHFDKMVNLASSSIVNRTPDKMRPENAPAVTLLLPPEAAARYPKYVPERQRHTCGAKGCSYTSVDEAMLRCHWDTLHAGATEFLCVHCPPHQHLDTSKPLTAIRVISHLKMHDATLFACSLCSHYHFKREALERHNNDIHKGAGRVMVVREEYSAPASPGPSQQNVAPTMDLKPWQCGLCKFKSMLRPEVVDHCFKFHQSKMQFKCAYCPFRTSAIDNISKHQTNSHAGKPEEVFYYYYRAGSIADDLDGTPCWMKQRQKANISETEVKVEASVSPVPKTAAPSPVTTPIAIDLNLVKKEVDEVPSTDTTPRSIEDLCKLFGQFCEPNGIKFKCPLCTVVMEDTREEMQSHLYEELNYRKWSCALCSYKAFHKAGLTDHMTSEHRRNIDYRQYDYGELPTDLNIEKWVTGVLDRQAAVIDKHKENLLKQKNIVENNKPASSTEIVIPKEPASRYSDEDLNTAFGPFGTPNNIMYCCPKCGFMIKEEATMSDHLELELNKIRWCCSNCPENFQTYHEAQFHCKGHDGPSRPVEAIRNPAMRAAWISTAVQRQKTIIQSISTPPSFAQSFSPEKSSLDSDNSLLVVRYEEPIANPDQVNVRRKRPMTASDDERLVIVEPTIKKKPDKQCPHCDYMSVYSNKLKQHMLTHYNLKPYTCGYCKFHGYTKKAIAKHIEQMHCNKPLKIKITELPSEPDVSKLICLVCEESVLETDIDLHLHNGVKPQFAKSGVVIKCCVCLALCIDVPSLHVHHNTVHPNVPINHALYKLGSDSREAFRCAYCNSRFQYMKDYKAHHHAVHNQRPFNVTSWTYIPPGVTEDKATATSPVVKRCARKSTTKLPSAVARKSTTKLPYYVPSSSDEYSYYDTKPTPLEEYSNVTTLMSFCNMMMPFTMKQLSEHINIEPRVVVTDMKNSSE